MKDANKASAISMQSNDQDMFEASCKACRDLLALPFRISFVLSK